MPATPAAIGLDIGGTKGAVLALDLARWRPVARRAFAAPPRLADYLRAIGDTIEVLRAEGHLRQAVVAGVNMGGAWDSARGRVVAPPHLPDWHDAPLGELLAPLCGCPVHVLNDANAGALAEYYWGAGRGCPDLAFVTWATGFGAGIVANGQLVLGARGLAGELGHLRLRDSGPTAYGKAGSVEAWCSGGCQAERLREWAAAHPHQAAGLLAAVGGDPARLSVATLCAAARAGDAPARELVAEYGRTVGRALAALVDLFNPRRLLLGSIYGRAHDLLAAPVRRGLEEEAFPASLAGLEVLPAGLGEAIGDYGALAAIRRALGGGAPPAR